MGKDKTKPIIAGSFGIGSYLLERGLDMANITLSIGWAIALWVIGGLLILYAIIMTFKLYIYPFFKRVRINGVIRQKNEEYKKVNLIPDILWKLHNRMMEFVEIRAKQDIDNEILQGAMEILSDRVGIVKLEERKMVLKDIKKQLGLGTRLPKSKKGQEELSLKLAGLPQTFPMPEKQWGLNDMIRIGESLDGSKVGVGNLRDTDKKWQHWYKELTSLQQNYADEQLDKRVSANILISYGCCSILLYTTYIYRFEHNEILSKMISVLRSATANIRVWVNDAVKDSIRPVINRIKELQSSESIDGG